MEIFLLPRWWVLTMGHFKTYKCSILQHFHIFMLEVYLSNLHIGFQVTYPAEGYKFKSLFCKFCFVALFLWIENTLLELLRPRTRLKCWPTPTSTSSVICWRAGGGGSPVHPGLHQLQDTGHVQEESQWGHSVHSVLETRGLEPNQRFFVMNVCK